MNAEELADVLELADEIDHGDRFLIEKQDGYVTITTSVLVRKQWIVDAIRAYGKTYTVGDATMEKVFKPAGLANVHDLQAVLDAVERALAGGPAAEPVRADRVAELLEANNRYLDRARAAEAKVTRMGAAIRSFMSFMHGLCCPGCSSQGRALADHCCKDHDCDAGFYGVDAEAIRDLLESGEALVPGTLSDIENHPAPINEEGGAA